MKKTTIWLIIGFIAFFVFVYISDNYQKKRFLDDNKIFDTTVIKGKVYKTYLGRKQSCFILEGDSVKYFFNDDLVTNAKIISFYDLAERGDSVYKAPLADTLFLYKKDGKILMFTFHRSWNKE